MAMKKTILFSGLLAIVTTFSQAQQNEQTQFLVGGKTPISGFGGLLTEFSSVRSAWAVSSGGGGAVLINQTFFIGGYGLGMVTDSRMDIPGYTNLKMSFGHGGFWLGYLYRSSKLIHVGLNTKLGWGSIILATDTDGNATTNNDRTINTDNVFVITPQLDAELNVVRWFKINVGAGYRWVTDVDKRYYTSSDFNSPTLTIGLLFGGFGRR